METRKPKYATDWDKAEPAFQEILHGVDLPDSVERAQRGFYAWRNRKGWRILGVSHECDDDKSATTEQGRKWIAEADAATPSRRDWKREYKLDFTISTGDPYFTGFSRQVHVQRCSYDPKRPLLRGWDFGKGRPAVVWAQLGIDGKLRILYSFLGKNLNLYRLAPLIMAETNARFPGAQTITDYGDPAGSQETDKGASTAILAQQFGIQINYRWSYQEEGLKLIEQRLLVAEDGSPRLLLDPINKDLIDGFAGGYQLETKEDPKSGIVVYTNKAKKDGYYEHLMDALRYMVLNLFHLTDGSKEEREKAQRAVGLWTTRAERLEREKKKHAISDFLA